MGESPTGRKGGKKYLFFLEDPKDIDEWTDRDKKDYER
jgi:hypothetical protein